MAEILLKRLLHWFEREAVETSTLNLVRRIVLGALPEAPAFKLNTLGGKWQDFEELRAHFDDDREFEVFIQCQLEDYREYRDANAFYYGYLVDDRAIDRYEANRNKVTLNWSHPSQRYRSTLFSKLYSAEALSLDRYFFEWLNHDEHSGLAEPDLTQVRLDVALTINVKVEWIALTFTYEEADAADEDGDFLGLWKIGKAKLLSKHINHDPLEYWRAQYEALYLTARKYTRLADNFLLDPFSTELSAQYQIGYQLYRRRDEFRSSHVLTIGAGNLTPDEESQLNSGSNTPTE